MFKGFFNRMYNGNPNRPDINPEDMPQNRFELFFTTLGMRIGDLVKLNLLFVLFLLPLIVWTIFIGIVVVRGFLDPQTVLGISAPSPAELSVFLSSQAAVYLLGLLIVLPLVGPPLAGLTYITRNYARDEHVWLWSDFKEQMKKNWKQSMAAMFIFALVLYVFAITMQLYGALQAGTPTAVSLGFLYFVVPATMNSSIILVMQTILVIFVAVFFLSYMYVFPMLVTYKLKIGQILKNSLMFSMGRLPFTLLFAAMALFPAVLGAILIGIGVNYVLLVLVLYYLLLGFSLTAFILNSYTNATFDRLLKTEEEPAADDGGKEVKP